MASAARTEAACLASAVSDLRPVRPVQMARDTFRAWLSNGAPVDVSDAADLTEAVGVVGSKASHKDSFTVEQNRADARRFMHVYTVTKSTKRGFYRDSYDGGARVFQGYHEAKLVHTMQLYAPLEPVAPWQWSDADRTGEKHGICPDLVADIGAPTFERTHGEGAF